MSLPPSLTVTFAVAGSTTHLVANSPTMFREHISPIVYRDPARIFDHSHSQKVIERYRNGALSTV